VTNQPSEEEKLQEEWESQVAEKQERKIRARLHKDRSVWFGLGTFGVVGWSVVVPTLLGLFLGIWIDRTWPGRYSWSLMFFLVGLAIGCYSAWNWLKFESGLIKREEQDQDNHDR
jgi:ATP synthase protein I